MADEPVPSLEKASIRYGGLLALHEFYISYQKQFSSASDLPVSHQDFFLLFSAFWDEWITKKTY